MHAWKPRWRTRRSATLRTRLSRPTVALLLLQSAARSTTALQDMFLPAVDRLRAGDRWIVCICPRDCCSLAKCEGLNSTHFSRLVTWSERARMAVSATPRSHDELYFFFGDYYLQVVLRIQTKCQNACQCFVSAQFFSCMFVLDACVHSMNPHLTVLLARVCPLPRTRSLPVTSCWPMCSQKEH